MDPLSVTASIIAVAGALFTVSRKLNSCARTILYAAKEVKAIAKEISAFSVLLRSLQTTYETIESKFPKASDLLGICEQLVQQAEENVGEFNIFLKGLKPLQSLRTAGLISKTVARLRWAFKKPDLLLLRSKLESSKSTLTLCMLAIQTMIVAEGYTSAQSGGKDEAGIRQLKSQVRLLKSQLRDQRYIVKDAIAASRKFEVLIHGQERNSVNLTVATGALNLTKKQLQGYSGQSFPNIYHRPVYVAPNNSSPPAGPIRPPGPPPSPRLPGTTGRGGPEAAFFQVPSGAQVPDELHPSRNIVTGRPSQQIHPMNTDLYTDMGYRTAQTLTPRRERDVRISKEGRNFTMTRIGDSHRSEDEGASD